MGLSLIGWAEEVPYQVSAPQDQVNDYEIDAEVVYNKQYIHAKRHEVSLLSNLYFRNDLNTTFGLGGSYAYHFSEFHTWEALSLVYLSSHETELRKQIQEKTGLVPEAENNECFLTTAYSLHPIYGKISWFGSKIFHFDLYFLGGGGARKLYQKFEFSPTGVIGTGFRFYLRSKWSMKLETRDFIFSEKQSGGDAIIQAFVPTLGISYIF